MRCVNCQKLGHTKNSCKNIEICKECGYVPPHEQCIRKFCVNCNSESHTSYDSLCPSFIKHKSVNKIKANRRCTVREAWKVFNENPSIHTIKPFTKNSLTFSDIVRNNNSNAKSDQPPTKENTNKALDEKESESINFLNNKNNTTENKKNNNVNNNTNSSDNNKIDNINTNNNSKINKSIEQDTNNKINKAVEHSFLTENQGTDSDRIQFARERV
ncbi:putative uncharacterized protein DDB_G0283051 [Lucilia sericata]|uniref:putative uncharacterized protein DDB_G0283051 n=1 Tax=Lucilia sericata TaxID=13632 RepID=UPI0018A856C3|nr:putative uncharacterized protein DDB_G0283051 [Lucilia sericata]